MKINAPQWDEDEAPKLSDKEKTMASIRQMRSEGGSEIPFGFLLTRHVPTARDPSGRQLTSEDRDHQGFS